MKKSITLLFMICMINLSGAGQGTNPFFETWNTPFGVPPFEKIKNEHYMPAFERAMKEHQEEIDAIIKDGAKPNFENTIAAFDRSGELLEKVSSVFSALNSANTNKEMQEIAKQLSPLLSGHSDDISLNPALFARIKAAYDDRENFDMSPDQRYLLEETYKDFVRGGAGLDAESKLKLRELNKEISMLQLTFGQNLLAETNSYKLVVDKKPDLAGLPASLIESSYVASSKDTAINHKWVFGLQNPSVMPFLQFSSNRQLREKIFLAYTNRCNQDNNYDNKKVITRLIQLRNEKAHLLGLDCFASFALDNRMAKKSDRVYKLLDQVWAPAISKAKEERESYQQLLEKDVPGAKLEGWDWRYYSEKVRKQRYELDDEQVKPYFQLENVIEGIFYVANKLYGITFSEVKNAPVYTEGVRLFECNDRDGSHLGVLYFDFHPRPGKRGGAWCGSYRAQSYKDGKRVAPVMTIVTNFTASSKGMPALLTSDETETLFHEFGHALHGLFKNVRYHGLASVPRDFVELPSQVMEHWAFEPEVLKVYAKHYKTGAVIPGELVEKIVKGAQYGQGFKTTEYLAACYLDMDYHVLKAADLVDVPSFEKKSMDKIGLIPEIPPRYRSVYFQHTMTGGYTAGYYSYIWAEVLDADAFEAFKETGDIFNPSVAYKFRKMILERGGSMDAMKMYIDFRGSEPGIGPLLQNRGFR